MKLGTHPPLYLSLFSGKALVGSGAAFLALLASPLGAHDFWLQPSRFWIAPGGQTSAILLVGHGAARQRSTIALSRIAQFRTVGPEGATDRKGDLKLGQPGGDVVLKFETPGTYVAYFSTTNVASELPALRFNDYASAEGLSLVLRQRKASGTMSAPGRELYSRRGKALIQVGPPQRRSQIHVMAPVGLGLEIVPLSNPYDPASGPKLPVQVLYQGKPLAGALVKLNNLAADAQPVETHITDSSGKAVFAAKRTGEWQFNVVWSQPFANTRAADFLTTFSSLSFGFSRVRQAR